MRECSKHAVWRTKIDKHDRSTLCPMLCSIVYVRCSQITQATIMPDNNENSILCLSWAPANLVQLPMCKQFWRPFHSYFTVMSFDDICTLHNNNRPDLNTATERPSPQPLKFVFNLWIKICANGASLKRGSGLWIPSHIYWRIDSD